MIFETLKKRLRRSHNEISHVNRVKILAELLSNEIDFIQNDRTYKFLDIGCGDMQISQMINQNHTNVEFDCIDVYEPTVEQLSDIKWQKYTKYNGINIPYGSKEFEASFFVDVLHHCNDINTTLSEAKRVSKYIVVKDHYEYGFVSRVVLQVMDFYGNWAYGVNVPKKYFTRRSFKRLCSDHGLEVINLKVGIALYNKLPLLNMILNPKWHFIAVLSSSEHNPTISNKMGF